MRIPQKKMLKHVQISPLRNRSDSVSLRSTTSCASSICGSPEPPNSSTDLHPQRTPSRASSYSSLSEQLPQTTIKVFTNCLKIDIEYKTLGIQWDTTSKGVIQQLLRRLKMRHRDPKLFYLSMEVCVRRAGVKTILVLDEDTRPAILQACHPKGESRFCLQLKPGGLIRVHTSALQPTSQYKSLVISEETTSDELLQLLLSCYSSMEQVEQFSIYEVCPGQEYQRKLHPDDIPLRAQAERIQRGEMCHFLVRRNPAYAITRRQLLSTLNSAVVQTYPTNQNKTSTNSNKSSFFTGTHDDSNSLLDSSIESISDDLRSLMTMASDEDEDCASSTSGSSDTSSEGSTTVRRTPSNLTITAISTPSVTTTLTRNNDPTFFSLSVTTEMCPKCRNNFKSCEFCHKNSTTMTTMRSQHHQQQQRRLQQQQQRSSIINVMTMPTTTYNPVYNIREIRTATHSFSSLGNDKKLLDIQLNGHFDPSACRIRPHNVYMPNVRCNSRMIMDVQPSNDGNNNNNNSNSTAATTTTTTTFASSNDNVSGNVNAATMTAASINSTAAVTATTTINAEAVNNNPAKGLGHFVYL